MQSNNEEHTLVKERVKQFVETASTNTLLAVEELLRQHLVFGFRRPESLALDDGPSWNQPLEIMTKLLATVPLLGQNSPLRLLTKSNSTSAGGNVVAQQEIIPNGDADPRSDFGPGFCTRCSICRKLSRNRGDMETRNVLCLECYHPRSNLPTLLGRRGLAGDANVKEKEDIGEKEQAALARAEADAEAARQVAERAAKAEAENMVSEFLTSHCSKGTVNSKSRCMFQYRYPLHVAVKQQDAEMVTLLLAAGADKSLKNSSGETPAQKAEKYCNQKECDEASLDVFWALGCRTLAGI